MLSTTHKPTARIRGFTIVELLIVIVVLGILAAISLNVYAGAQNRAKVAQAKANMATIKKAMLLYKADHGELPPEGDSWNYDTAPPSEAAWRETLEAMETEGYLGNERADTLLKDPWGRNYGYDDNDCNSYADPNDQTWVLSFGANGIDDEEDDVALKISNGCMN